MSTTVTKSSTTKDQVIQFEQIVNHHQRRLVALAFHMLGNWEEARDQAQEAFVRFWQQRHQPDEVNASFAYLARVVINLCIDRLRKRDRHRLFFWDMDEIDTALISTEEPERAVENDELKNLLESAVTRLKPRQKAIFILRDIEGYSVAETAEIIGGSENNVLVNLHKARKNLRKRLAPYLKM